MQVGPRYVSLFQRFSAREWRYPALADHFRWQNHSRKLHCVYVAQFRRGRSNISNFENSLNVEVPRSNLTLNT
jgi:hypothetical protein